MPIYEYACEKCNGTFEVIERLGAPDVRKCVKCSARGAKRKMSKGSFRMPTSIRDAMPKDV